jgi:hypothetical protein
MHQNAMLTKALKIPKLIHETHVDMTLEFMYEPAQADLQGTSCWNVLFVRMSAQLSFALHHIQIDCLFGLNMQTISPALIPTCINYTRVMKLVSTVILVICSDSIVRQIGLHIFSVVLP